MGVGNVDFAAGVDHAGPGIDAESFFPEFLSGLDIDALGDTGFVADVEVVADGESGADALLVFGCAPDEVCFGDISFGGGAGYADADGGSHVA